jgi:hypothetical protein
LEQKLSSDKLSDSQREAETQKWRNLVQKFRKQQAELAEDVVAAVDVNHVLQDEVVTFALGQIDDDAVGILLERGEFFIAAQVVVFCQLRLLLAEFLAVKPPCKSCSRKARLWSKN